ncbi:MAG: leucine-rich repeat protein, partial [Clostridia bacterium]|nr:leucine-rich repeat protein [Clostridia bacterium]
ICIPRDITYIGSAAFCNCTSLTGELELPEALTTIEEEAFENCAGLTGTLEIPKNVTAIGNYAFYGCKGFTGTLNLPDGLETIGYNAFKDCVGITKVYVPNSVTAIGGNAFGNMTSLEELTIPFVGKDRTTDGSQSDFGTLFGSTNTAYVPQTLKKVTITDTEQIPDYAFYNAKYIETIVLPDGLISIDNYAFVGCSSLTEIFVPMSVTTFGTGNYNIFDANTITVMCCMNSAMSVYAQENEIPYLIVDRLEVADGGSLVVNYDDRCISGFANGMADLDELLTIDDSEFVYESDIQRIVNGSNIDVYYKGRYVSSYMLIYYGDVNGDGWYNGMDATIVECIANGMLTKVDVGEAAYMAADCNHDGVINAMDVALLNQAGLLLANIDQTMSEQELTTDSNYIDYIELIDQTPDNSDKIDFDVSSLFVLILEFIKKLISMIFAIV